MADRSESRWGDNPEVPVYCLFSFLCVPRWWETTAEKILRIFLEPPRRNQVKAPIVQPAKAEIVDAQTKNAPTEIGFAAH